jgi:glycosyltransferase involved in cell wall biosynthesis
MQKRCPVAEPLRILIVTHAPLAARHGAAQLGINLGRALRQRGNDVTLWSPHPLQRMRWWKVVGEMRRKLDDFVGTQPSFDVIDLPASMITKRVARRSFVVARSVQPELAYLAAGLGEGLRPTPAGALRMAMQSIYAIGHSCRVLRGWARADLIVCLGRLELEWMSRYFPGWKRKLASYVAALPDAEQRTLEAIRAARGPRQPGRPIRFLWIGRWARHKGNAELLRFMERWLTEHADDSFTVAGCGAVPRSALPETIAESARVAFRSEYERDQLPALLRDHDIGLFSSRVEGWGLSLNEMLESGMLVFATCAGGVPELSSVLGPQIRPFPPDRGALQDSADLCKDWTPYYDTFSWDRIADRYLKAVRQARERLSIGRR